MKNYRGILCLVLLLFAAYAQAVYAQEESGMVFTDHTKPILVDRSKPEFDIVLQSNPTTGFQWVLKSYDTNLIELVNHHFYPPEKRKLVGAPGYEKWTFRVKSNGFKAPQLTSITLAHLRVWEDNGAEIYNFKVVTNHAN